MAADYSENYPDPDDLPVGTEFCVFQVPHKIGRFGLVYYYNGENWVTSTKTIEQINSPIKLKVSDYLESIPMRHSDRPQERHRVEL
jgi:hypothetical protein